MRGPFQRRLQRFAALGPDSCFGLQKFHVREAP
jgi:hypothetical protein